MRDLGAGVRQKGGPGVGRAGRGHNHRALLFREDVHLSCNASTGLVDLQRPLARFVLNSVRDQQDAEDICQDVWTRVDAGLHALREPAAAHTWVYRTARHAIVDAMRRRSRRPESVPLSIDPPAPAGDDPAVAGLSKERAALAWQTLAMLPIRQRMALYLKEVEERRYSDIALATELLRVGSGDPALPGPS